MHSQTMYLKKLTFPNSESSHSFPVLKKYIHTTYMLSKFARKIKIMPPKSFKNLKLTSFRKLNLITKITFKKL